MLFGQPDGFQFGVDVEFVVDILDVFSNRGEADKQFIADFGR